MSYRRDHKRRHSQAFMDEDEQEETHVSPLSVDSQEKDGEETLQESKLMRKKTEIWDAFREEHYEVIEQLPLSLHRQYILLRELDEQAQDHNKQVLPTIKRYIELRRNVMSHPAEACTGTQPAAPEGVPSKNDLLAKSEPPPTPVQNLSIPLNGDRFSAALSVGHSGSLIKNRGTPTPLPVMRLSSSVVCTPTPMSIPPNRTKMPQTTREILSHIAWLSEEILRASDEKVNLTQAAYDSVDRHIRLLNQSIKEQEASIALGVRPGTHLAPILLPEVIVPGSRVPRQVQETVLEEQDGEMTLGMVSGESAYDVVQPLRRGRVSEKGRSNRDVAPTTAAGGSRGRTLKLNGPAPEISIVAIDEERYCYCNQVSFGEMVACDNDNCPREWFHLGCVGLDKPPGDDESWYCRDCQHLAKATKSLRNRKKKR